jgi:hypothetical protein
MLCVPEDFVARAAAVLGVTEEDLRLVGDLAERMGQQRAS